MSDLKRTDASRDLPTKRVVAKRVSMLVNYGSVTVATFGAVVAALFPNHVAAAAAAIGLGVLGLATERVRIAKESLESIAAFNESVSQQKELNHQLARMMNPIAGLQAGLVLKPVGSVTIEQVRRWIDSGPHPVNLWTHTDLPDDYWHFPFSFDFGLHLGTSSGWPFGPLGPR